MINKMTMWLPDDVGEQVFVAVNPSGIVLGGTATFRAKDVREEVGSWFRGGWSEAYRKFGIRVRRARIVLESE